MFFQKMTILVAIVFFLIIFAFGFLTSRSGRPHNSLLMNIHKLTALAVFGLLIIVFRRAYLDSPLSAFGIFIACLTGLLFIINGVTGGLVSVLNPTPLTISLIHKISPYLTLLSSTAVLYLLLTH
jgi:hypothetical protein